MNLAEQAVFTSAETSRTAGYQLAATSNGLSEDDARALSTWGPSHGALGESGPHAASINFHPLPSGNFCVSRTTASGNEYSGRGTRVYTQCLIVSPEMLRQFANNPFAIVRAASGSGLLKQYEKVPAALDPVPLVGRAPAVEANVFSRARRDLAPEQIACLVQTALTSAALAITGTPSGETAVAALLNCLPPQVRTEFSFSTGLKVSTRRPFRLLALGSDPEERHRTRQIAGLTLIDLAGKAASRFAPTDAWARAIFEVVKTGGTSLLNRWFERHPSPVSPDELNALGLELLDELAKYGRLKAEFSFPPTDKEPISPEDVTAGTLAAEERAASSPASNPRPARQLAHAAHSRFAGTSTADQRLSRPSEVLACDHPQVVASLETLDDLVYDAVKGAGSALMQLQSVWPQIKAELGDELLGQSREQYLRYALQVWGQCVADTGFRPTDRAVNALEVLCLLFDDA